MTHKPAVLITGASQRVGAVLDRRFAAEGFPVVTHYRASSRAAEALRDEIRQEGGWADIIAADLTDPEAVGGLVAASLVLAPGLKVLINSAAVFDLDTPAAPDTGHWREAMEVNALAPARLAADLHARVEGGTVIHILDQKLSNPNPDYFSYTAAKAALAEVARMQAMAFAPRTRVICLSPGLMLPSGDQTVAEHAASAVMNLLGRPTTPEDLAEACLLAASGALATGETLYVDGGQHLVPQARDVMFLVRGEA